MANLSWSRVNSESDIPVTPAENIKIFNLPLTTAGNQYSYTLQSNSKQIAFRSRSKAVLQYTFTDGETNTTYFSVMPGVTKCLSPLNFTGKILYVQSSKSSDTLEIEELY